MKNIKSIKLGKVSIFKSSLSQLPVDLASLNPPLSPVLIYSYFHNHIIKYYELILSLWAWYLPHGPWKDHCVPKHHAIRVVLRRKGLFNLFSKLFVSFSFINGTLVGSYIYRLSVSWSINVYKLKSIHFSTISKRKIC